jgi:hypothetical protein
MRKKLSKSPAHVADASTSEPAATLNLEGECGDRESAEHRLDKINLRLTRISSGSLSKTQGEAYDRVNASPIARATPSAMTTVPPDRI